jgi:predicted Holliday junction resolvase-like endonuclease
MHDGLIAGGITLIPSTAAVYLAMRNPKFLKATNWQSRTAIAIMPPLFMFGLTAEMKLSHSMEEMARQSDHSRQVSEWAEKVHEENKQAIRRMETDTVLEKKLHAMYKQSVENSGVRIVPGDSLAFHHKVANFWQENPFKILAGIGVPTVLYIFRGRSDQKHLQLQSKLMHTRVFGQFAVVSMLLGLMGFKTYMDSHGKYITQHEADMRVEDMKRMRADLLRRIEFDKQISARREQMLKHEKKSSKEDDEKEESAGASVEEEQEDVEEDASHNKSVTLKDA